MSIRYEIDRQKSEILVRISGPVFDEELLVEAERILQDRRFPTAPRILADARERRVVASPDVVRKMVNLLQSHHAALQGGRCALVTDELASFGMQRMFSMRAEESLMEIDAFQDIDEARRWLAER